MTTNWKLIAVVCGSLVLAWYGLSNAVVSTTKFKSASTALRFGSTDPTALSVRADELLAQNQDRKTLGAVLGLARESLKQQAVNSRALRILSAITSKDLSGVRTGKLLNLALKVTRRDIGVNILLIERNVEQNDIAGVLRHYDIALRTNKDSPTVLFPLLARAVEDPRVQQAFLPYLRQNPLWLSGFLTYYLGESQNPAALADMGIAAGGLPDTSEIHKAEGDLVESLVARENFNKARQYYLSRGGSVDVLRSVSLSTDTLSDSAGIMGWRAFNPAGVSSEFTAVSKDNYGVQIIASAGARGIALRKLLYLAPGNYRIEISYHSSAMPRGSAAIWELKCATGSRASALEFTHISGLPSMDSRGFTVPSGCTAQFLELTVAGGAEQGSAEFQVYDVKLGNVASGSEPPKRATSAVEQRKRTQN